MTIEITAESVLAKLLAHEPLDDSERAAIRDGLFDPTTAQFMEWSAQWVDDHGPEAEDNPDDCAQARADGYAPRCVHSPADHLLCGPRADRNAPGCCPDRHQTGCPEAGTRELPWSA